MKPMNRLSGIMYVVALTMVVVPAWGQWDPDNGQWGKTESTDLRVMTWNVADNIDTLQDKTEAYNDWSALTHIVASMKPDILFLQETGDTGSGVDSVANLEIVMDLFMYGGPDPFLGGTADSYVQKYDSSYDLPYVYVSSETDGYNRNILLSRFPFADLNGDGKSSIPDIPTVSADEYAPGGDGGIRGFMFAEIDLDDQIYLGDFVFGGAHLKAGGTSNDKAQRLEAAQNVAYYIDYLFNGAGTGNPDPHSKIWDLPPATSILGNNTPVVLGGDWNEDEDTNGRDGPAFWLARADDFGGTDGTDRDRTDSTYDDAREHFTNQRGTYSSTSKLDYLLWQDSIATLRRAFIFYSNNTPIGSIPPELLSYPSPTNASAMASNHRTVLIDIIVPLNDCSGQTPGDTNGDGSINSLDVDPFVAAITDAAQYNIDYAPLTWQCTCDINCDGGLNSLDIDPFVQCLTGGCPPCP